MNPQLQAILADFSNRIAKLENTRKPLSDEEIKKLMEVLPTIINTLTDDDLIEFARSIEERHGIK